MNWYLKALSQYAKFSGRACRREYWTFTFVNLAIYIVLKIISDTGDSSSLGIVDYILFLFALAIILPSLAVQVRRLHDIGKNGLWILINIVPIIGFIVLVVFCVRDSDPGANDYGPPPAAV